MRLFLFFLLLAGALQGPAWADQPLAVRVLEDPQARLSIEQVVRQQQAFQSIDGQAPNFGITTSAYWLELRFQAPEEKAVLEVRLPQLDDVRL